MKLFTSKEERIIRKAARKAAKKLKKELRIERRSRHKLALGVVLHADRTMSTQEIDLSSGIRTIFFNGIAYNVPLVPYRIKKWWPYKSRTWKRKLFPDEHHIIVWLENEPNAMDCAAAIDTAEHQNIIPSSLGGLLNESLMSKAVMSMKSKNKTGMSNKMLAVVIVIVIVLIIVFSKIMGMW